MSVRALSEKMAHARRCFWRLVSWPLENWQVVACVPFVILSYVAHKICQTIAIGCIIGWTASRDFDGEKDEAS